MLVFQGKDFLCVMFRTDTMENEKIMFTETLSAKQILEWESKKLQAYKKVHFSHVVLIKANNI